MLSAGFEPTIPASKRPQTHASDRAATGIGFKPFHTYKILGIFVKFVHPCFILCKDEEHKVT
jgi:hypothetical protein